MNGVDLKGHESKNDKEKCVFENSKMILISRHNYSPYSFLLELWSHRRMSDAKAKAEARRAKILARDGDRLSVAKGEKV